MALSQQSPIDLTDPVRTEFGGNQLKIRWTDSAEGELKEDEHGVHVVFSGDMRNFIILGRKQFHLVQFHFHHPSEHWIKGVQQTMELHVVHQNKTDGTRAVLAIFIDMSTAAVQLPNLVGQIHAYFGAPARRGNPFVSTNPKDWLPRDVSKYYRYEGSLTTPEYDENVSWVVFKNRLLLPQAELVKLIKLFIHPARLPQPLNRRFLLANFRP
ncbi:MAG: carbonic anhydrase family protein [Planctomycetaceae bacterium]